MRDDVLATTEFVDASSLHLYVDLSLPLPCIVSAGAGKAHRWSVRRCWSHRHNISLAEAGGTATGRGRGKVASRTNCGACAGSTPALQAEASLFPSAPSNTCATCYPSTKSREDYTQDGYFIQ